MKNEMKLLFAAGTLCTVLAGLAGCSTGVTSRSIPMDHPANPEGPAGTAAPVILLKTDAPKPAESDEPAQTEHHHHGM